MKRKVTVFCGAKCRKDREAYYFDLAYRTGKLLAEAGFVVITGAGPGLMHEVLRGAREVGGETIGIALDINGEIPSEHAMTSEIFGTLAPRQERLITLADAFIALPGGVGTMYEISAIIALKKTNEIPHDKPFVLVDSYYDSLFDLYKEVVSEGFVDDSLPDLFTLKKTPEEAVALIKSRL